MFDEVGNHYPAPNDDAMDTTGDGLDQFFTMNNEGQFEFDPFNLNSIGDNTAAIQEAILADANTLRADPNTHQAESILDETPYAGPNGDGALPFNGIHISETGDATEPVAGPSKGPHRLDTIQDFFSSWA